MSLAVFKLHNSIWWRLAAGSVLFALLQFAGLAILYLTEDGFVPLVAAVLAWGSLNFLWLALLRTPALAAAQ